MQSMLYKVKMLFLSPQFLVSVVMYYISVVGPLCLLMKAGENKVVWWSLSVLFCR